MTKINCPKCKSKDYYGYSVKGELIKKICLSCDYEEKMFIEVLKEKLKKYGELHIYKKGKIVHFYKRK